MRGRAQHDRDRRARGKRSDRSAGSDGMIHRGGCHCGNLHVSLRLTQAPEEVRLRACGSSFCRAHNTRTASDRMARSAKRLPAPAPSSIRLASMTARSSPANRRRPTTAPRRPKTVLRAAPPTGRRRQSIAARHLLELASKRLRRRPRPSLRLRGTNLSAGHSTCGLMKPDAVSSGQG